MVNLKTPQCFIFSRPGLPVVPGNLARSLQHIRSTRHPTRAAPQRLQKNQCPFDPNYIMKKEVLNLCLIKQIRFLSDFHRKTCFTNFLKASLRAVQCDRSPFQLRGIWVAAWTAGIQYRANLASTVRSVSIQVDPPKWELEYYLYLFSVRKVWFFHWFYWDFHYTRQISETILDPPGFSNWSPKAGPLCRPAAF